MLVHSSPQLQRLFFFSGHLLVGRGRKGKGKWGRGLGRVGKNMKRKREIKMVEGSKKKKIRKNKE